MEKSRSRKAKTRKFFKVLKRIFLGNTLFQIFFRVYLLTIILGAVLLYIDASHPGNWLINDTGATEHKYTFWDALFVSCSAFSNTGLTSVVVGEFYNFFGQFVIFALIGLGGIGIISLFFVLWNLFKKADEIKLEQAILLQNERGTNKVSSSFRSIRFCVFFIISVEIVFGLLMSMWLCFYPVHEISPNSANQLLVYVDPTTHISSYHNYGEAFWQGMFTSVSAMNNAGFDIFKSSASLASFRNDWNVIFQLMTMILIVIGGIGYPIIFDLYEKARYKKLGLRYHYSLFTKVASLSYLIVFLAGLVVAFGFEYGAQTQYTLIGTTNNITNKEWGNNPEFNKAWAIIYNTVVTRSAGFSTVNQSLFTIGTQVNYSIMMFIGASPSSTGGGIRCTTLAIMTLAVVQMIRKRTSISIFHKKIPGETVRSSFIVFSVGLALVILVSGVLLYLPKHGGGTIADIEGMTYIKVLYEVSSAIGTFGLTMGVSANVHWVGLAFLVLLMFVGQMGISGTLLSWFKKLPAAKDIQYSEEDVRIG
mgnify:CR=1 FL=1